MTATEQKVVVIYKTKQGSTKQYAEWIAEEVKADLFARSEVKATDLLQLLSV